MVFLILIIFIWALLRTPYGRTAKIFYLNSGVLSQYFSYLGTILTGDLGPSVSFPGSSVILVINEHLSVTLGLNPVALVMVFLISIIFIWALLRRPDGKTAQMFYFLS